MATFGTSKCVTAGIAPDFLPFIGYPVPGVEKSLEVRSDDFFDALQCFRIVKSFWSWLSQHLIETWFFAVENNLLGDRLNAVLSTVAAISELLEAIEDSVLEERDLAARALARPLIESLGNLAVVAISDEAASEFKRADSKEAKKAFWRVHIQKRTISSLILEFVALAEAHDIFSEGTDWVKPAVKSTILDLSEFTHPSFDAGMLWFHHTVHNEQRRGGEEENISTLTLSQCAWITGIVGLSCSEVWKVACYWGADLKAGLEVNSNETVAQIEAMQDLICLAIPFAYFGREGLAKKMTESTYDV